MRLSGKRILLGVTGSIAAYKTAELIRLLIKEGAEIQVIMTESAHDFVAPLTLSTLSRNPVLTHFSSPVNGTWNNHVELGLWADLLLIAPATAQTLAKLANGYCEDLLSAIYLSARCPVFFAPAMDLDMYAHPATAENISRLSAFGNRMIGPGKGELASGLSGEGRMSEPGEIVSYIIKVSANNGNFKGKKVLISAGPTREAIDSVRYISNHSSGKMGVALAEEMSLRGAEVTLVCGPQVKKPLNSHITFVDVISAEEMFEACFKYFHESEIIIMAAAVADYTPTQKSTEKLKKETGSLTLELTYTKDILSEMGKQKNKKQFLVGFALESQNDPSLAKGKLERKNLDMIVYNTLYDKGAGFNTDTNKITIIEKDNSVTPFELKSKKEVAADIADKISSAINRP